VERRSLLTMNSECPRTRRADRSRKRRLYDLRRRSPTTRDHNNGSVDRDDGLDWTGL